MGHYNFHKDLKDSKKAEHEYYTYLWSLANTQDVVFNNDNKHDLLRTLTNSPIELTYEVKDDKYSKRSGNAAFETRCRGKPSGITVTQAHWWVHKCYDSEDGSSFFLKFNTEQLKEYVLDNGLLKVGGDKGSNTHMYLVKVSDLCNNLAPDVVYTSELY